MPELRFSASLPLYRSCPLCESTSVRLVKKATSAPPVSARQIQVTEKYFGLHGDLVRCGKCGFTYVGEKNYIKKITSLYSQMSDSVYLQEERERRLSFRRVLARIESLQGGRKGKVLDIGCCTGGLLVEAKKRGWNVYGVDPSLWACKTAKRLHHLSLLNTTIESYRGRPNSFDAITILDVLEHVENPKLLVDKVRTLLKKDGVVCIVTPDYGSVTARLLRRRWWGIRLAHLSYFKEKDIYHLIEKNNFCVLQRKTYVRYFSLYYILVRLLPFIERMNFIKLALKHITVPLALFDTFEIYLGKRKKHEAS